MTTNPEPSLLVNCIIEVDESSGAVGMTTSPEPSIPTVVGMILVLAAAVAIGLYSVSPTPYLDPPTPVVGPCTSRFDDPDHQWDCGSCDQYSLDYLDNNKYRVQVHAPDSRVRVLEPCDHDYEEFELTMGVSSPQVISGTMVGFVFGFQDDKNCHAFAITTEGKPIFWRMKAGGRQVLSTTLISKGIPLQTGDRLELGLNVDANTFTCFLNGTAIAMTYDDRFEPGRLGLFAYATDKVVDLPAEFHFDSFTLEK